MWSAIQVTSDDGKTLWLTDPDRKGHRRLGNFESAAIFWQTRHAETANGSIHAPGE